MLIIRIKWQISPFLQDGEVREIAMNTRVPAGDGPSREMAKIPGLQAFDYQQALLRKTLK